MTALLTADEAARLVLGVNVIVRPGEPAGVQAWTAACYVAPQDWVALTGPCPNVRPRDLFPHHSCSECRDGRRIVPLYRRYDTIEDTAIGRVLVGRGIVPQVFQQGDGQFAIVIDVTELA